MPVIDLEPSAFPHGPTVRRVSVPNDLVPGGFVSEHVPGSPGMTLRDYFAAAALSHMIRTDSLALSRATVQYWAGLCYVVADAMVEARQRPPMSPGEAPS